MEATAQIASGGSLSSLMVGTRRGWTVWLKCRLDPSGSKVTATNPKANTPPKDQQTGDQL